MFGLVFVCPRNQLLSLHPAPHTSCNGGQLCQDQLQTFGMTAANINSQLSGTPVAANEAGCAASETSEAYAWMPVAPEYLLFCPPT